MRKISSQVSVDYGNLQESGETKMVRNELNLGKHYLRKVVVKISKYKNDFDKDIKKKVTYDLSDDSRSYKV